MEYKSVNINLTEHQKSKLKSAFKNNKSITIQFSIDQLKSGKDQIFLTNRQYNKLEKHKKNNKGLRIDFSLNQLKYMKNGGLLKDILDFADNLPIVKNITPYVRKASPIIKNDVIPIVRNILDWLDKELKDVSGSGLDEKTLKYVRENLKDKKNFIH